MNTHFSSKFRSSDKQHDIAYYVVYPQTQIKGVVQIAHGMCEHFGRYNEFAEFLADNGYVVCGEDHLGHGRSVNSEEEYGYFTDHDGWQFVVDDMHKLAKMMKKSYPQVPYILFGHSMGSFLSRAFVTKYGSMLDGAVFSGTGVSKGISELFLVVLDIARIFYGDMHRGHFFNKLAFGKYNDAITPRTSIYDWLTRDPSFIEQYCNDEMCGFTFTLNGFENLIKVLWYVSNDKWYETYPKQLPTLLVSGSADPVGDYGKGVLKVYNGLNMNNCNVEMKLYKDARHELIHELNKDEVFDDLLDFLDSITP